MMIPGLGVGVSQWPSVLEDLPGQGPGKTAQSANFLPVVHVVKKPGRRACACNPSTERTEVESALGITGPSDWPVQETPGPSERQTLSQSGVDDSLSTLEQND